MPYKTYTVATVAIAPSNSVEENTSHIIEQVTSLKTTHPDLDLIAIKGYQQCSGAWVALSTVYQEGYGLSEMGSENEGIVKAHTTPRTL